jgi:tetratricopeptide (TPR) repeat protein
LIAADPTPDGRQVAMVDSAGRVDVYTGKSAIAAAGHQTGAGYSVQANLMASDKVWPAMAAAYERAQGDLADRLLAALDAAQAAGGDIRGQMSAALLVVEPKSTGRAWGGADRVFDLRVETHAEPLKELRRLVRFQRAANESNRGDALMTAKRIDDGLLAYENAAKLAPEEPEFLFWYAATLVLVGREGQALPIFKKLFATEPVWADVLQRLPAVGLFPADPGTMTRIRALVPRRKP